MGQRTGLDVPPGGENRSTGEQLEQEGQLPHWDSEGSGLTKGWTGTGTGTETQAQLEAAIW